MMCTAMRTRPAAGCKAQVLELVTASGTRLRRRIEGADLCKDPAFMLRLVFALAHEFTPSCIGNRLCKMRYSALLKQNRTAPKRPARYFLWSGVG